VSQRIDTDSIIAMFDQGGNFSENLLNYEYRKQQIDVVREVIKSFNQHNFSFIEAGTGTGKSFAYLIPALYWSHLNDQVVVISTNTINLQEQLIKKDLVFLKKILPFSFKAVLVKGRRNYLCKRKFSNLEKRSPELFLDNREKELEFVKLLKWYTETRSGSYSDLDFVIKTDLWDEVASETELCLGTKCPFFKSCFFMRARKEVYSADILIVNHHLLILDALIKAETDDKESAILPHYSNLIIDEAHNFYDSTTNQLGRPFYYHLLNRYLEGLFGNKFSLLVRLRNRISEPVIESKLIPQIQRVNDKSKEYFNSLKAFFAEEDDDLIRLTANIINMEKWLKVKEIGQVLTGYLDNLVHYLGELDNRLSNESIDLDDLLLELNASLLKFKQLNHNLAFNLEAGDEDYVFWLEKGRRSIIKQENAPLVIGEILNEVLWNHLDNLVLTSATLTVNRNFGFFQELLGLEKSRTLQVDSPFNYQKQARLIIPVDIPPANSALFLERIIANLEQMLVSFGGNTLVLFTSYKMLNYCKKKTEKKLQEAGITLLSQGEYQRNYIIQTFKNYDHQIIFGTASFWEGIDIKGDNLKYLIIMKLPFPVPSEPVAAARMEKMSQEGKNPFYHYSLPRAVIKFKQGFGRLIRSKQDQGIVISLDNRLLTKSYGQVFLKSLPVDCPVHRVDLKSISAGGMIK
jgi:ATP-dependent DNA helicase DinG